MTVDRTSTIPESGLRSEPLGGAIKAWAGALSLETLLYLLLVGLAFFLRARDLTASPLSSEEAARAYQAWRLIEAGVGGQWSEPVPTLLAAGSFFLFGSGDLAARVCSALLGSALPAVCWLLRPLMGRRPALWAALLFSVSPLAVYYSRILSGEATAAVLALLFVAAMFRFVQSGQRRFALLAAPVLPALLLADALAVGILLIAILYFALVYAFGSSRMIAESWQLLRAGDDTLMRMAVLIFASFLLLSTTLLTNLSGFGLPTLGRWLAQFGSEPSAGAWYYHLELLLAYEPLVLLLGSVGLVMLYRQRSCLRRWWAPGADVESDRARWDGGDLPSPLFTVFIAFWTVAGLFLLLTTASKTSGQIFVALLPLTLLAGIALDRITLSMPWPLRPLVWVHLGLLAGVFGFFVIMVSQVTWSPAVKTLHVLYLILSAAGTLLVLASTWQILRRGFVPVLSCVVLVALGLFSLHALARTSQPSGTPELIYPARAEADLADAVRQITAFARQRGLGRDLAVMVDPAVQWPLRWYLRDVKKLVLDGPTPEGVWVAISAAQSPPENDRAGGFLVRVGQVGPFQPEGPLAFWRWLIYGEAKPGPEWTRAFVQFHE